MAKRISIINFKGGVGKTTLAFNFAAGLARFHKARVLLVDMDHQSSLSVVCLGTDGWEEAAESDKTVTSIFKKFLGSELPRKEIVHGVNFGNNPAYQKRINIVPADLDLDDTEILLTQARQGESEQSEWSKRTLICRWLEETKLDEKYDYVIFDCAPATKIVSQNAIAASHGYIVPVVPEAVMQRGAPHLRNLIESGIDRKLKDWRRWGKKENLFGQTMFGRALFVPNTKLVGLVVTQIKVAGRAHSGYTNDHTQHIESLKRQWGKRLVEPYILQGAGVGEAITRRVPVYDVSMYDHRFYQNVCGRGIDQQFKDITATLKDRVDKL